jgi:hypothetical protein
MWPCSTAWYGAAIGIPLPQEQIEGLERNYDLRYRQNPTPTSTCAWT